MRRVIDIAPGAAALDAHRAVRRVDADALHAREVDHQAVVAGAEAGAVVAAAAHGEGQAVLAGEVDGADHIGHIDAAGNQRRALVDHAVVDLARLLVVGVARLDQLAAHTCAEILNGRAVRLCLICC